MKFTTTSVKIPKTENCPINLPFGVRPRERSWMTLEASSKSPRAPIRSTATSDATNCGDGATTSKTVITTAMIMITPPIVGVPCFTR